MVRQVDITKIDLSTGKAQKITDYVAEEVPLHLFVNTTFWATILCSPTNLKELGSWAPAFRRHREVNRRN